jgi:hypothetical protein
MDCSFVFTRFQRVFCQNIIKKERINGNIQCGEYIFLFENIVLCLTVLVNRAQKFQLLGFWLVLNMLVIYLTADHKGIFMFMSMGWNYCSSPVDMWVWRATVVWYWQRKLKNQDKNLSQCHFVNHKSHMDWPRHEPMPLQWGAGD